MKTSKISKKTSEMYLLKDSFITQSMIPGRERCKKSMYYIIT